MCLGRFPRPPERFSKPIDVVDVVGKGYGARIINNRISEENEVVHPFLEWAETVVPQNSGHCICESSENAPGATDAEWGDVIYVAQGLPENNEVPLLIRVYGTAAESSIDVKCCGLRLIRRIHHKERNLSKCSPFAYKYFGVDFGVDGGCGWVVLGEGEVLDHPIFVLGASFWYYT